MNFLISIWYLNIWCPPFALMTACTLADSDPTFLQKLLMTRSNASERVVSLKEITLKITPLYVRLYICIRHHRYTVTKKSMLSCVQPCQTLAVACPHLLLHLPSLCLCLRWDSHSDKLWKLLRLQVIAHTHTPTQRALLINSTILKRHYTETSLNIQHRK